MAKSKKQLNSVVISVDGKEIAISLSDLQKLVSENISSVLSSSTSPNSPNSSLVRKAQSIKPTKNRSQTRQKFLAEARQSTSLNNTSTKTYMSVIEQIRSAFGLEYQKQQGVWLFEHESKVREISFQISKRSTDEVISYEDIASYVKDRFLSKKIRKQDQYINAAYRYAKDGIRELLKTRSSIDILPLIIDYMDDQEVVTIGDRKLAEYGRQEKVLREVIIDDSNYIDHLSDDSVTRMAEFMRRLSSIERTVITLLEIGYNQREICKKLKIGLDQVSQIITSIRGKVLQYKDLFDPALIKKYI